MGMSEQQRFAACHRRGIKGFGQRPNPAVGCVVVKGGEIIATGYHVAAGRDHAEVMALGLPGTMPAVRRLCDPRALLHYGRTPLR